MIVDATQTAFSRLATYPLADYIFVSYRKWTDCLCAAVYAKKGFSIVSPKKVMIHMLRRGEWLQI